MFRLVETQGGKLAGQVESVKLNEKGTIADISGSIDGVTDGKNINFTVVPSLIPINITVAGTRDGDNLTLTASILGVPPTTRIYTPSDLATFQRLSADLRNKSQSILTDKAAAATQEKQAMQQQKFTAEVETLVSRIEDINPRLDIFLSKLPTIEQQYQAITAKEQSYYGKVNSVAGSSGNNVAISINHGAVLAQRDNQIIVAMNQGVVATNQIHTQVQSVQYELNSKIPPLTNEVLQKRQGCDDYAKNGISIPECDKLKNVGLTYAKKLVAVEKKLEALEHTYNAELAAQQNLVAKAEQMQ